MTYFCSACCVSWWPYQAKDGRCPECGRGTKRTQEPGSLDADSRFKAAIAAREAVERRERAVVAFEAYYAERESERIAAAVEALIRDAAA